jgi:hypothetical protein
MAVPRCGRRNPTRFLVGVVQIGRRRDTNVRVEDVRTVTLDETVGAVARTPPSRR